MRRLIATLFACVIAMHAQDWAKAKLDKSPRRHEQVSIQKLSAFVVYPDTKDKRPAILLVHDAGGLTEWFKSFADEVAAMGFVAVAPDLKSEVAGHATPDLNAVAEYAKKLPASNGILFVAGIGWGGEQSFRFASERADVSAALDFCGAAPDKSTIAKIQGSVFGFFAANDPGVDATIAPAQAAAKAAGVVFETVTYDGVGPNFMESDAPGANPKDKLTRGYAMERMKSVLDMVALRGY
ncbi:MAG TPA: dienelactone hydrolase family protein [Bryobacteraceae bacterium]|nr:dienelactone hydrolase family protein [Bryobacteraceae bacterium]